MKKLKLFFFALLTATTAWADVEINETNFPDANFRNWVLSQTYGGDGMLTDEEIADVTSINVWYKRIQSLKGIEYFTALTELSCGENQLTELDVSKNTALTTLGCGSNKMTAIDVSGCPALTTLYCYGNQLTELDVSGCTALTTLDCYGNQLTTLDVSGCPALTTLKCYHNHLTELDVSKNTELASLNCSGNKLTELNVSNCPQLSYIECFSNQIKDAAMEKLVESLPSKSNTRMYVINFTYNLCEGNVMTVAQVAAAKAKGWKPSIYSSGKWIEYAGIDLNAVKVKISETNFPDENFREWVFNQEYGADGFLTDEEIVGVTSMDMSRRNIQSLKGIEFFTALTLLDCSQNQIKDTAMDVLVESLPTVDNGEIHVVKESKEEGNMMTVTQVTAVKAKGWTPMYNDGKWVEYIGFNPEKDIAINEDNFPDWNFRFWLISRNYGKDGILTDEEIAEVTSIDVNHRSINSLKGIEYFTALTSLDCSSNQIVELDVSKNLALVELYCYTNQLTSLDVSQNTSLEVLKCNKNQIALLDLSKNSVLKELYCGTNQLTALDVSKNTALTKLSCGGNQLTELDISRNTTLTSLYCNDNQLTELDASECNSLNGLNCRNNPLIVLNVSGCTALPQLDFCNGVLTTLDVSGCSSITSLYCSNNKLTSLNVSGCTGLSLIVCWNNQLQGEGMEQLVESLPTIEKGELAVVYGEEEQNMMTIMQVAAAKAKGWTPTANIGGQWQDYAGSAPSVVINEETFPDEAFRQWVLSKSYGQDGVLTSEEIASVKTINISETSARNMKGIEYFAALEWLISSENAALEELDASKNTRLMVLICRAGQLKTLNVKGCTALERLVCNDNQLTSLDVSGCTKLWMLSCSNNQLTELNVEGCTQLAQNALYCYGNQLKGEDMDRFIETLPTVERGMLVCIYDDETNVITTTQVAAAKAKGWGTYRYLGLNPNTHNEEIEPYEGSPDGISSPLAEAREEAIYNLAGQKIVNGQLSNGQMPSGINIIRYADGTSKKVLVK